MDPIRAIVLHPTDTVANTLVDIVAGDHIVVSGEGKTRFSFHVS